MPIDTAGATPQELASLNSIDPFAPTITDVSRAGGLLCPYPLAIDLLWPDV
jgi:hypothetical protein